MSKYGLLETQIADQKYLIATLGEMGYRVEVHPEGAALVDASVNGQKSKEETQVAIRHTHLLRAVRP